MIQKTLIIGLFLVIPLFLKSAIASDPEKVTRMQNQIYRSFVTGDIVLWESTIAAFERYYQSNPDPDVLYDLLLARYGLIAFSLEEDTGKARAQLNKAESELETLFAYPEYLSSAYALEGAFLGFRISLRPLSAIRLGPRSYKAINNAIEADPNNPAVWMEVGNSRFYTPSAFGGSKQEALDAYLKAVQLFEKDMQNNQRWLYLNSLVGLAKSYEFTDRKRFAIATYKKALTFEPEFKWVRDELLPQILE